MGKKISVTRLPEDMYGVSVDSERAEEFNPFALDCYFVDLIKDWDIDEIKFNYKEGKPDMRRKIHVTRHDRGYIVRDEQERTIIDCQTHQELYRYLKWVSARVGDIDVVFAPTSKPKVKRVWLVIDTTPDAGYWFDNADRAGFRAERLGLEMRKGWMEVE